MSFLKSLFNTAHAQLDSAAEALRDPAKELDLSYHQMQDLLTQSKSALTQVVAQRISLDQKVQEAQDFATACTNNAKLALAKGDETLAKNFLAKKQESQAQLQSATSTRDTILTQENSLKDRVRQLESRLSSFASQKEVTKAELVAGKAQVEVSKSLSGIGGTLENAASAMELAQSRASNMQNTAKALDELQASGVVNDPFDKRSPEEKQLAALQSSSNVDDELAALKKELSQ